MPAPLRRAFLWLRRPGVAWIRIPLGLILIVGGLLGFLPLLGFWMVPIGVLLLAEDMPFLRRPTIRALGWAQAKWDRWRARRHGAAS
jgi:purine-cytosine permease-like protein